MQSLRVQTHYRPREAYQKADEIGTKDTHPELKPLASDFDLLLKSYLSKGEDIGRYVNDSLPNTEAIERTHTWQTAQVFAQ